MAADDSARLLANLSSADAVATLSDREDDRVVSEEQHVLASAVSDPAGFRALVRSGRLPLGLHRALLLSGNARLLQPVLIAGDDALEALWTGLLRALERAATESTELIPAALLAAGAAAEAATAAALSPDGARALREVLRCAEAMAASRRWDVGLGRGPA